MTPKKITIRTYKSLKILKCKDILFFKGEGRYTNIFTVHGEKYLIAKVLKQYECLLCPDCFYRISKSIIVNLDYIKEYIFSDVYGLIMDDDKKFQVSARRRKSFIEKICQNYPKGLS